MLERETITIESVEGAIAGDRYVLRVKLHNPTDRTLYAYSYPRRVEYDNATRRLRLQLHDHGYSEAEMKVIKNHLKEPHVAPLLLPSGPVDVVRGRLIDGHHAADAYGARWMMVKMARRSDRNAGGA